MIHCITSRYLYQYMYVHKHCVPSQHERHASHSYYSNKYSKQTHYPMTLIINGYTCTCTYIFDKNTTNQMRIFCSFGNQFSTGTIVPEKKKDPLYMETIYIYFIHTASSTLNRTMYLETCSKYDAASDSALLTSPSISSYINSHLLHQLSIVLLTHSLTCIPTPKLLPSSILGTINCIQILSCKNLFIN